MKPDPVLVKMSRQIHEMPLPLHQVGNIVIVPPGEYAVIRFVTPNLETVPPIGWVYGVSRQEDTDTFEWFEERLLVDPRYLPPAFSFSVIPKFERIVSYASLVEPCNFCTPGGGKLRLTSPTNRYFGHIQIHPRYGVHIYLADKRDKASKSLLNIYFGATD